MKHIQPFSDTFADRKMCIFPGKSEHRRGTTSNGTISVWTNLNLTQIAFIPFRFRFHFPHGKPLPSIALETTLQRLQAAFDAFPNNSVSKENFTNIMKITGLPFYWRMPLFNCTQLTPTGLVDGRRFCDFWKQYVSRCIRLGANQITING